jgi:PAS domain S-box-containing protein
MAFGCSVERHNYRLYFRLLIPPWFDLDAHMANAGERYWLGPLAALGAEAVQGDTAWRRYIQAGSILLACLVFRAVLDKPLPGLPPFITLFPAVAITGLVAGTRAGIAACVIGLAAADYFWIEPRRAFGPLTLSNAVSLALYVAACASILTVTHASREARARAQAYFDVAEVMLVVVGIDRRIKAINRHGVMVLGAARPADLIGQDWFEVCVPAEERAARLRSWTQAMANFTLAPYESEILCRNGSRRLIRWRQTILRDATGRARAVLASGDDVTETREIEAARRRSEARLNAILRQVPAAVSIIEPPDGRLALRSDRSEDVLGHLPILSGDAVSWQHYGGIHADGTPFAPTDYPIMRALFNGETVEGEQFHYRRPDGTLIDLEVYAAPIRDQDGTMFAAFGIAFDISVRAAAERKLRIMLDERELLLREADHRIKNSLQLVVGVLSLQRRHTASQETASALTDAIARVTAVAEAHLALQLSDDLQNVEFGDMLAAICRRLDALSDTVRVICECGSPVMLEMDRAITLALIISELITNALRHAYDGKQKGEVRVAAGSHGHDLVLTVRDFGAGFDAATSRSGLGSRVTGNLAAKIGCSLQTQSRLGEGTCVTLRLRTGGPAESPKAESLDEDVTEKMPQAGA